jgi:hypothetical protein
MTIHELTQYKVLSYKTKTSLSSFGKAYPIHDEDAVLRIKELFLIRKYGIQDILKDGNWVTVNYKTGEKIWLEVE